MSDNAKNRLQEYCQQKRISLPRYNTREVSLQKFRSTVILLDKRYTGSVTAKKATAEISAAEGMLKLINTVIAETKIKYRGPMIGIFIDCENKQKIYEELDNYFDLAESNIHLYLFISETHDIVEKVRLYKYGRKYYTKSVIKDAVDIHLIYTIGKNLDIYDTIIIVSADHFAKVLEKLIADEEHINTFACMTIDDITKIINKYNNN